MRRCVLTALLLLALAPARAAAAPNSVFDFEAISPGTTITDQYAGVTGVRFGDAALFGLPVPAKGCGAPTAIAGGIAGTSAGMVCSPGANEFSDRQFGTAIEFATERRAVSFRLSQRVSDTPRAAEVSAYAIGGRLLEQRSVSLDRNAVVSVAFSRPTSEISGLVISGTLDRQDLGQVLLDDLVATLDDVPPPPKFSLALATPAVEVVEGSTAEATLSVRRFNGSSGPVTLSVDALPSGIKAAAAVPNPLTGTNPAALRITADSPFAGQRQLTVTASGSGPAGTGIGAQLVQSVTGVPAFSFATGGRSPIRLVPGCGPQSVPDSFNVRGDYTGFTGTYATAELGKLNADVAPGGVNIPGAGVFPLTLKLDPGAGSGGEFFVGLLPLDATPVSLRESWIADPVKVGDVAPTSVARPLVDGGSTVTVTGNFPPRCSLSFVDGTGKAWTQRTRDQVDVDGRLLDRITLNVPATGVSGPLRVLRADGKAELGRTARVAVQDFRNVYALSQANGGTGAVGTYNWGDFVRTFGSDDADACFVICVRDPIADKYFEQFRSLVTSGAGLCAGWTIMAARFRGFNHVVQRPSDYQAGSPTAWLISPLDDGTDVKRDVVRWHVAQLDKSFVAARDAGTARDAASERTVLRDLVDQNGAAYIGVRQGTAGHAVVAYALQNAPGGGLIVSVNDPNIPYSTTEERSADDRATKLAQSTITIDAAGNWSGTSFGWSGPNSTLAVVAGIPPDDATLPTNFSLTSLLDGAAAAGLPPAAVTQITSGGKPTLDRTGQPLAGSGVALETADSGVAAEPSYRLDPGHAYAMTVRGSRAGGYEQGLLGRGAAASVRGASTVPGQEDTVTVRPGRASLAFRPEGSTRRVSYALVDRVGRATRTATVDISAGKGGEDAVTLGGGALRLSHAGRATTASVTLGSVGAGLPGTVITAPLRIGGGQRLELRPRSWAQLADGVGFVLKTRSGRVVRRGRARLRPSGRVRLAGVRARRSSARRIVVSGRVTKSGQAPVLVVAVEVVRKGRVLRRKVATRRGPAVTSRFSLPVEVPRIPRGARLRTSVTLLDEGAALATVRRVVSLRR